MNRKDTYLMTGIALMVYAFAVNNLTDNHLLALGVGFVGFIFIYFGRWRKNEN